MSISKIPLAVDLDGTLIKNDLLVESFIGLIKAHPINLLWVLFWLFKGKAHLKSQIADRVDLSIEDLPYNEELIDFLKQEKQRGREIILATASHQKYAHSIAAHLKIFDDVLATDAKVNLSGCKKRNLLTQRYGRNQYAYAGNASVDLKVWAHCRTAVVVGSKKLAAKTERLCPIEKHFSMANPFLKVLLGQH